ncbi:decaprenyl-phosphate phosphoribosyltransferase [Fulvivirga maritima]|uniref:decaprenyl-phosphate phosphoribosyltransferase n=1 Tax=Fulvivirga maritima TaxID=2904247 RepID=UPI001F0225DB|nr:decaprenyl-phosphate phosphoribosyltransferase [Fulvivirga maritima]UII25512.1 decaprenyl-phosphate phosphoribosyltransferase [Fulvivirga maritima]
MMLAFVNLLRASQWVKNLFIFIPAFFAGVLFDAYNIALLITAFLAFSSVASAIYIFNDYNDIQEDRNHPVKKFRPIASGQVSEGSALTVMLGLLVFGLCLAYLVNTTFLIILVSYLIINFGYSQGLKKISILDIIIIAIGFVLRTLAGAAVVNVLVSHWLIIMIFLLALFMALAKRLDDVIVTEQGDGKVSRANAKKYNLHFIHSGISMLSAVIVVAYIMYTLSDEVPDYFGSEWLYFTSIFVITGLLRYLQITLVEGQSGSPTQILYKDKFTLINILCWILSFLFIIYF